MLITFQGKEILMAAQPQAPGGLSAKVSDLYAAAQGHVRQQVHMAQVQRLSPYQGYFIWVAPSGTQMKTDLGFDQEVRIYAYGAVDTTPPRHELPPMGEYAHLYTGTVHIVSTSPDDQLAQAVISDIHRTKYPSTLSH